MKVAALEEHFVTPGVLDAWYSVPPQVRDYAVAKSTEVGTKRRLLDLADERIADMDDAGVDLQVLSVTTTGVQNVAPDRAVPLARAANDLMAETIRARPDRFEGFATLPTSAPADAARELERSVLELGLSGAMIFGRTGDRNVDHPDFAPILEMAAGLRAPLYLHPQSPPPSVRAAYYEGLADGLDTAFGSSGIGWHYETGIQAVRLVLTGVLDRLPDLQLILGHWGEVVLFYLDRLDLLSEPAGLSRNVSDYFRTNVSVTPSGMFSQRYLRWAVEILGIDRVLFATDYPFVRASGGAARRFLLDADVGEVDRDKIASGNWAAMTGRIRRS